MHRARLLSTRLPYLWNAVHAFNACSPSPRVPAQHHRPARCPRTHDLAADLPPSFVSKFAATVSKIAAAYPSSTFSFFHI